MKTLRCTRGTPFYDVYVRGFSKKRRILGIQMRGFLDPPKIHNLRARFNFQTTPSSPFLLLIGWKPEVEIPEVKMMKSVTSDVICWKTGPRSSRIRRPAKIRGKNYVRWYWWWWKKWRRARRNIWQKWRGFLLFFENLKAPNADFDFRCAGNFTAHCKLFILGIIERNIKSHQWRVNEWCQSPT